jgi:hypothetical protein
LALINVTLTGVMGVISSLVFLFTFSLHTQWEDIRATDEVPIFGQREKRVLWMESTHKVHRASRTVLQPLRFHSQEPLPTSFLKNLGIDDPLDHLWSRPVYWKSQDKLIPAYHVQVSQRPLVRTLVLNSETGSVLLDRYERDQCASTSHPLDAQAGDASRFRMIPGDSPIPMTPHRTGEPDDFFPYLNVQMPTIEPEVVSACSPVGWVHSGPKRTEGNNVSAWAILNNQVLGPILANVDQTHFIYPTAFHLMSHLFLEAATVNAFHRLNWLHDRLYDYGFQERDGNLQLENFDRGGVEGDRLLVDVHWRYNTINGAFYSGSEIDGTPGYITLYRFVSHPQAPDRLSAFDNQVLIHEGTHAMTRRLVGRIDQLQSLGLNEGWSDVVSLVMLAEEKDDLDGVYSFAGWPAFQFNGHSNFTQNYYFGFRRYPTTTDFSKNPLTLNDIDPYQFDVPVSVPRSSLPIGQFTEHGLGEIWSVSLWQIFAQLRERYPFHVAQDRMMRLIVAGQKLSPENPTFLQARDAFLEAERLLYSGENRTVLWKAFALRGMGVEAWVPPVHELVGVKESFSEPDWRDYNQDGVRETRDLKLFFEDYERGFLKADVDRDHRITAADAAVMLRP